MNDKRYKELLDMLRRGERLTDKELTELAEEIIDRRKLDVQDDQQRHRKED